jgi:hypothetical protein
MQNLLSIADACRRLTVAASSPGPARALRALAARLGRCRVMDLVIDRGRARADLLALDEASEVAPGDLFYAGLRVSLPLERGRVRAAPLFVRLACFNRLVWSGARCGAGVDVRRLLAAGLLRVGALRVDGVGGSWARALLHAQGLPGDLEERLEEAWRTEGAERSRYGVLNALTRLATHERALPVATRRALARAAARVAFGGAAAG